MVSLWKIVLASCVVARGWVAVGALLALLVASGAALAADPKGSPLPPPLNSQPGAGAKPGAAAPAGYPSGAQPLPKAPPADAQGAGEESLKCPAKFITALCADLDGNIYVATEDDGLWRWVPACKAAKFPAPAVSSALPPPLAVPPSGGPTPEHGSPAPTPPAGGITPGTWQQFTVKDGLSDTCYYAVACDKLGRVWCGSLRHGVDVYNGQSWQNYNVIQGLPREGQSDSDPHASLAGPLGAHVFAIATCPTDGDVWISTEAGLSRYSLATEKRETEKSGAGSSKLEVQSSTLETPPSSSAPSFQHSEFSLQHSLWSYYTRAEGLPSDQASCLAFNRHGDIFVGTQCDGISMARASEDYKTWRTIHGPDKMPVTAAGSGLPTDLINCLLVVPNVKSWFKVGALSGMLRGARKNRGGVADEGLAGPPERRLTPPPRRAPPAESGTARPRAAGAGYTNAPPLAPPAPPHPWSQTIPPARTPA